MAASPMAGASATRSAPTGVSAFGFGGSMAHIIVDSASLTSTDAVRPPLRYARAVAFPWKGESPAARLQDGAEKALLFLESVIQSLAEPLLPPDRELRRCDDLFAAGLSDEDAPALCAELSERLSSDVTPELLRANASPSRLALALLSAAVLSRATSAFSLPALVASYLAAQLTHHAPHPRRGALPSPVEKLPRCIVFVLAGPRSGSTLLQLVLNAHPGLYAGQELYLLQFATMAERRRRLDRPELRDWAFEGLRKAVMELRGCELDEADEILAAMEGMTTSEVFGYLQAWAGDRLLVDKTPPYVWNAETLRRAEDVFAEAQYIHIHRHPYATLRSMAREAVNKDFLRSALGEGPGGALGDGWEAQLERSLWEESEKLWVQGNANVLSFFAALPEKRRTRLSYEELVEAPAATAARLCAFLRLPRCRQMAEPYASPENLATFEPAAQGGLGAADPKLLARADKRIDADMALGWLRSPVPRPLSPAAAHLAACLGYQLPAWKEPHLRVNAPQELVRLNEVTGGRFPPLVFVHGMAGTVSAAQALAAGLPSPCFGLRMTHAMRGCASVEELAQSHAAALKPLGLPPGVVLVAADAFGVRLAKALAKALAGAPRVAAILQLNCAPGDAAGGRLAPSSEPQRQALLLLLQEAARLPGAAAAAAEETMRALGRCEGEAAILDFLAHTLRPAATDELDWDVMVEAVLSNATHAQRLMGLPKRKDWLRRAAAAAKPAVVAVGAPGAEAEPGEVMAALQQSLQLRAS